MEIVLTPEEIERGAIVGIKRRIESQTKNRKLTHGLKARIWDIDIEGSLAEMVYCKFKNEYWSASIGSFKNADHKDNIQIRHTTLDNGCLILRTDDNDSHYYVLVTGISPVFNIRGWILGSEGKKEEYIKSPAGRPPAYFIPQEKLNLFKEKS